MSVMSYRIGMIDQRQTRDCPPRWRGLMLVACLVAAPALATGPEAPRPETPRPDNEAIVHSQAFLSGHPDLRWRLYALREQDAGNHERALRYFQRAARYADKPAQAAVAEMLWEGTGVTRDRPLAYAWMDLAAERGQPKFIGWREHYWQQLDEAGREQALQVGQGVYAEYGDDVAKPRQERVMRRARRQVTGSRTGMAGSMLVVPVEDGHAQTPVDGSRFHNPKYWDPELYWHWQDEIWDQLPQGIIEVLPLRPLEDDEPGDP